MKKINKKILFTMFLFSFIFYFSPFFVGANTTVWYYTGGLEGAAKFGPFTTKPECEVSLLNYKKEALAGKTTPCESSVSSLEAAKPIMEASLFSEQKNKIGKFAWVLQIKTANLLNGVVITGALYDTADSTIIIDRNTATINNNSATYYTKGSILENNKEYTLVLNATNGQKISTNVWFTKTVGKEGSTITTKEIDLTSTPVLVAPQTNTPTNSGVYNLLAPLPGMTTAPKDMGDYFNKIFLLAIGLCGGLAVVMLIIGGIQYMGDESIFGKTEAKGKITSAIFGLLIALGAYALLNTINPELLGKGVTLKQLSVDITEPPMSKESSVIPADGVALGTLGLCPSGKGAVILDGKTIMNTCKTISQNITSTLLLAKKEGINLSGSSFRSYADQVQARTDNKCPNVLTSPAGDCKPPAAIPGTSMHESGLAIDFRCDGVSIATQDNKCFLWLKKNTASHKLINYPKEPWHWSTTGH